MKFLTSGKVKDVYEIDDVNLLFKFSDRVSAYDVKFQEEIPQKETTPFYPRSPYAVAKLYAYWIIENYNGE